MRFLISVLGYIDCLNSLILTRNILLHATVEMLHGFYVEKYNRRGEMEINGESDERNTRLV
jgi:hypothetical protein